MTGWNAQFGKEHDPHNQYKRIKEDHQCNAKPCHERVFQQRLKALIVDFHDQPMMSR